MIPLAYIQAWRAHAPWPDLRQVEQDLIICRTLCDLFSAPALNGKIAFRGGTAIHKLLFAQPLRYSEDIDLVQTRHSMHLVFRFHPEVDEQAVLKLKVEINTREHDSLQGLRAYPFNVDSEWYGGKADIQSFTPEELFGTKLRALLQRRKNRDLFDLYHGLEQLTLDASALIANFEHDPWPSRNPNSIPRSGKAATPCAAAWTPASTRTTCWCCCSSSTSATSTPASPTNHSP